MNETRPALLGEPERWAGASDNERLTVFTSAVLLSFVKPLRLACFAQDRGMDVAGAPFKPTKIPRCCPRPTDFLTIS